MKNEMGKEKATMYDYSYGGLYFSQLIGAILFYLINFGRKPWNAIDNRKNFWRNVILGYIFNLAIIVYLFYLIINFSV